MSQPTTGVTPEDNAQLRAAGLPAAALATGLVLVYLAGISTINGSADAADGLQLSQLRTVAASNNYIAAAIALASLGQIAVESYVAGASLLVGLFLYDAVSVFKSDLMITVATTIEAPVKFLFAGASVPEVGSGKYPFGVLGLGDIVIPGVFLAMLREFDVERWWHDTYEEYAAAAAKKGGSKTASPLQSWFQRTEPKPDNGDAVVEAIVRDMEAGIGETASIDFFRDIPTPYFAAGLVGYAVGLGATFVVLYSTGKGQPALFYIVPSLLAASLGTAFYRDEVSDLWSYRGARAREAKKIQDDWKQTRDEEKQKEKEAKETTQDE
jgi:minor histocompatibility antigen H13